MPQDGSFEDQVDTYISDQLERFRAQLLDLSRRNDLLNLKHDAGANRFLRVVDERHDAVFDALAEEQELGFLPLPDPRSIPLDEESEEFLETLAEQKNSDTYNDLISDAKKRNSPASEIAKIERRIRDRARLLLGMPPWEPEVGLSPEELARRNGINPEYELDEPEGSVAPHHVDDQLQTLLRSQRLESVLRNIADRARQSERSFGFSTLFTAFGFLEWYEDDDSEEPHLAPLILVPVDLRQVRIGGRRLFRLRSNGQPSTHNVTLSMLLDERFSMELPSFQDNDGPEDYFARVAELISAKKRWKVRRYLTMANLPFAKIAIYQDLDPKNWPGEDCLHGHSAIRSLIASAGGAVAHDARDYSLDAEPGEPGAAPDLSEPPPLITDADSSQHSAIVDALRGEDLAIKGPPGSGKSQTITNLIAAAIDADKTVLFVAEKLTALSVVADRLHKAGLGVFCLNLHGRTTTTRDAVGQFAERLSFDPPRYDEVEFSDHLESWRDHRDALKHYADGMNATIGASGDTVHHALWNQICDGENGSELPARILSLDDPGVTTRSRRDIERAIEAFEVLERAHEAVVAQFSDLREHPWRGVGLEDAPPVTVNQAIALADAWRQSVVKLQASAGEVLGENVALETKPSEIEVLVRTAQSLPISPRSDWWESHCDALESGHRNAVLTLAASVGELQELRIELTQWFEDVPTAKKVVDEILESATAAGAMDLTPDAVKEEIERSRLLSVRYEQMSEAIGKAIECLGLQSSNDASARRAIEAARVVKAAPREILLRRQPAILDESNRDALATAGQRVRRIGEMRTKLDRRFHLASLPTAPDLRRHASALRGAGTFSVFSSQVKDARGVFAGLSRGGKATNAEMAEGLAELAAFVDATSEIENDGRLRAILGDLFDGAHSNIEEAARTADWAAAITADFGGDSEERRTVRERLFTADISTLDELKLIIDRLSLLAPDDEWPADLSPSSLAALTAEHAKAVDTLQNLCNLIDAATIRPNVPIGQLCKALTALERCETIEAAALANDDAAVFFGTHYQGASTNLERFADDLGYVGEIEDAEAKCLVNFGAILRFAVEQGISPAAACSSMSDFHVEMRDAWTRLRDRLQVKEDQFFANGSLSNEPMERLAQRAQQCAASGGLLAPWLTYCVARHEALQHDAAGIIGIYDTIDSGYRGLAKAYRTVCRRGMAHAAWSRYPRLMRLRGPQLDQEKAEFRSADTRLQIKERTRIAAKLKQNRVEPGVHFGSPGTFTNLGLIQYQVSLERKSISLRNLLHRSIVAAKQLKPCFMMSPLTVSQFLPRQPQLFDLVIIDEASQMRPADALGAIARARQCIIVGDPEQLGPTSFFQAGTVASDDEDEANLQAYVSSILDMALRAFRPTRTLRWHYRSRHSSLIEFSNRQFYEDKLVVFPAADEASDDDGVHFHHVPDGRYQASINAVEARMLVEHAIQFMSLERNRGLSMAVVAMNVQQRDLLEQEFERAFTENPQAARYRDRWQDTLDEFVVKNLEAVQGDERDVIHISLGFGPDPDTGVVNQGFGAINSRDGHRRLNVLFTRARRAIHMFSSIRANDVRLQLHTNRGVRVMRDYLGYAATGRRDTGRPADGASTESPFEEFVKKRLEVAGFEVDPQVGVGNYRVDLGVRHSDYPHGYLLGVECDGATYHSAPSVRDRDRLRQQVLEGLGWEIYRIWSTDWFLDADKEMERLLNRLFELIATAKVDDDVGLAESPVVVDLEPLPTTNEPSREVTSEGFATMQSAYESKDQLDLPETAIDEAIPRESGETLLRPIGIGDTVTYCKIGAANGQRRQVEIVSGPDDPANGKINDGKPLAIALIGCVAGDIATVRDGKILFDIEVVEVTGPEPEGPDVTENAPRSAIDGSDSYHAFEGRGLPDPRTSPVLAVANAMLEIIDREGPVGANRVIQSYVAGVDGASRASRQVRKVLNRAVAQLERDGRIEIDRPFHEPGYDEAVFRIAGKPAVCVRSRGIRTFHDIPANELATVMRKLKRGSPRSESDREELFRNVLERYDLVRLTSAVRERLNRVLEELCA